jgi:ATP-dependent Clp protease, protease subunit
MKQSKSLTCALLAAALAQSGCLVHFDERRTETGGDADSRPDFGDPVLNGRKILVFGEIDEGAGKRVIQELLYLDSQNHDPIQMYLMTPGGDFSAALSIAQVMRLIASPVNTCALAECNSGGTVLLAAGTGKRKAFAGGMIVVHGVKVQGKLPRGMLAQTQSAYTQFWRQRTRLPESWLPLQPNSIHVLSAEQALQYGIVDEVVGERGSDSPR